MITLFKPFFMYSYWHLMLVGLRINLVNSAGCDQSIVVKAEIERFPRVPRKFQNLQSDKMPGFIFKVQNGCNEGVFKTEYSHHNKVQWAVCLSLKFVPYSLLTLVLSTLKGLFTWLFCGAPTKGECYTSTHLWSTEGHADFRIKALRAYQ